MKEQATQAPGGESSGKRDSRARGLFGGQPRGPSGHSGVSRALWQAPRSDGLSAPDRVRSGAQGKEVGRPLELRTEATHHFKPSAWPRYDV